MRILIAEDNEDSRVYLERALKSQGYIVDVAVNGVEALNTAQNKIPDLIISDIMMPEMDGFEFCRRVKEDNRLKIIPFVFYTATYLEPHDRDLGLTLGASLYISKPMEINELFETLKKVLEEQKAGTLKIPDSSTAKENEINVKYLRTLANKLNKKIRELENEHYKLQKSEQKYRRLVENLKEEYIFYSHGTDGVFTYLSPSIHDVIGYTQEEFFTHYTEYLTDNPMNKIVKQTSELAMQGIQQPPYEMEIFHKNGSVRILEVTELPIFDKNGEVMAIEGIAHDITERKSTEEKVKQYHEQLEELVKKRTAELEKSNLEVKKRTQELEMFNKTMVGRELRIIEMKEEVNELCKELGREPKYPPVWGKRRNRTDR